MDLWVVFLTGLTIGGVSCMAVQGGLLASTIAVREGEDIKEGSKKKHGVWPVAAFLITKLLAYTMLGFALGAFGGAMQISDQVQLIMQFAVGLYMIAVALNILNVHPIFRYVIIQPPKFLFKKIRNQSKSKELFAPALLGGMTILIPCGTTIAMEALAISSGNAFAGAAILAAFVLGTTPLFFILGYATTALGDAFRAKFLKIAAVLVIYLGLSSINGALILSGSPVTAQTLSDAIPIQINLGEGEQGSSSGAVVELVDGFQVINMKVLSDGYAPEYVKVQRGIPVKLNLTNNGGYSCAAGFVIPSLGIRKNVLPGESKTVEFTPEKEGKISFSCSMGMYRGWIEVIN